MANSSSPLRSQRKASNPVGEPNFWFLKKSYIHKLTENYVIHDSVKVSTHPMKANIYTGKGIHDDVLILSPQHL